MNRVIVWTSVVGSSVITTPSPSLITRLGGIDQAIAYLQSRPDVIPTDATNVAVKEINEIPSDWTFRDAWKSDLTVDMPKARLIHMGRIRAVRNSELAKLDVDLTKAIGQKDDTKVTEIERERQTLRDIPQTFDLTVATTPDQLKTLWPAKLPRS